MNHVQIRTDLIIVEIALEIALVLMIRFCLSQQNMILEKIPKKDIWISKRNLNIENLNSK